MASAATQSRTRKKAASAGDPPPGDRTQMIAEAAYYLAEKRGFSGGDPMLDWLNAEVLIDQTQASQRTKPRSKSK